MPSLEYLFTRVAEKLELMVDQAVALGHDQDLYTQYALILAQIQLDLVLIPCRIAICPSKDSTRSKPEKAGKSTTKWKKMVN